MQLAVMDQDADMTLSAMELSHAEMSHVVRLDEITAVPATATIDASANECDALAARFDLLYVHNLSVELTYRRVRSGQMVRVDGRISATYGQLCAATNVPMALTMEEEFQTEYTLSVWEKVSEFDLDQPEVLTDDFLDLGEISAQYFGLAIDPYARRAGAETLAELTDILTEAARELAGQADGYAESATDMGETVEFAYVPEDIEPAPATAEIIAFPLPDQTDLSGDAPAEVLAKEQGAEPESLFFKYLRRLQSQ